MFTVPFEAVVPVPRRCDSLFSRGRRWVVPVAPSSPASVAGLWGLAVLGGFRLKAKPSSGAAGHHPEISEGHVRGHRRRLCSFCVVPESRAGSGESPTSTGLSSTDKQTCPRSDGHLLNGAGKRARGQTARAGQASSEGRGPRHQRQKLSVRVLGLQTPESTPVHLHRRVCPGGRRSASAPPPSPADEPGELEPACQAPSLGLRQACTRGGS